MGNGERLKRVRSLFTEHGAAQNDDVLGLVDALLADDEPSEQPADVRPPGALDSRDGFGMSAQPAPATDVDSVVAVVMRDLADGAWPSGDHVRTILAELARLRAEAKPEPAGREILLMVDGRGEVVHEVSAEFVETDLAVANGRDSRRKHKCGPYRVVRARLEEEP